MAESQRLAGVLGSFAAQDSPYIGFAQFVGIAKCVGCGESDKGLLSQLFQAYDTDDNLKLDLEELADGWVHTFSIGLAVPGVGWAEMMVTRAQAGILQA